MGSIKHCQKLAVCLALLQLSVSQPAYAQNSYGYASLNSKVSKQTPFVSSHQSSRQEKQTLFSVLKELNRVKGVYFLFSEQSMGNLLVKANKDYESDTEKILIEILKDTGLKYKKVSANTFVIVAAEQKPKERFNVTETSSMPLGVVENGSSKKAPDPIRGRITSAEGQPLTGVSIRVKGTSRGTTTNANGEFSIEATRGETLLVSYVGFGEREFLVGDSQNLAITLNAADSQLSEVVVTALGIRKERKALGYSV
ncbi:MAG TPA: carboxypeptidase-like regulatory domain-containing protein, partial [Flavisolibacter sp.]